MVESLIKFLCQHLNYFESEHICGITCLLLWQCTGTYARKIGLSLLQLHKPVLALSSMKMWSEIECVIPELELHSTFRLGEEEGREGGNLMCFKDSVSVKTVKSFRPMFVWTRGNWRNWHRDAFCVPGFSVNLEIWFFSFDNCYG